MSRALLFLLAFGALSTAQETSGLIGVIRDALTQQPIEGARVRLVPYALRLPDPLFPTLKLTTHSFVGFETTTDVAGRYRVSGLPPHRYCVSAEKQGYWSRDDELCRTTMIRTEAGRNLERDLTLDHTPSLTGRFIDSATNAPISGLRLVALQHVYLGGSRQWTSRYAMKRGKGAGEFEMLPPRGEFYLEIVPDEAERIASGQQQGGAISPFYGRSYYPGVTDINEATAISFSPGENRVLEIRIPRKEPKSASVEIRGVSKDAKVQLALERRTVGYFASTLAKASIDAGDPVEIQGLSEAEYTLIAWTVDGPKGRIAAVQRFSTKNRRFSRLRLNLEPTLSLHLVVRAEDSSEPPPGDWTFSMRADGRENPDEGYSVLRGGSTSAADLYGLIPGRYQVYAGPPTGWVVSEMRYGALDAIHQIFSLNASAPTLSITLSRRFGAVTGTLTGRSGPMDNGMVVLVPEPMPESAYVNSFPWSNLDESGRYEFHNVPSGRYRVIPFYGNTLGLYHDLDAIREHAKGYFEVNVAPDKTSIVNFASGE